MVEKYNIEKYPKDEKLTGVYVKRCKCGARPYHDRLYGFSHCEWIACGFCGRTSESDSFKVTVSNWNKDKLNY